MLFVRIKSEMPTDSIGQNQFNSGMPTQLFQFNTTAKVGMSLKINSAMPTTAKE
jgi:hypothetical protein